MYYCIDYIKSFVDNPTNHMLYLENAGHDRTYITIIEKSDI